jgi:hypothetical protein
MFSEQNVGGSRPGEDVTGSAPDVLCGRTGLAGRVLEDRVLFRHSEPERPGTLRSVPGRNPAAAQPGQCKPGRQPAAAVPHRHSVTILMARQADGVAGDLAQADLAEPQPHQHPGFPQPGEEPGLVPRLLCCPGDDVPEHGPRRRG